MALSELETKRIEKLVGGFIEKRRPPAHIRSELDFGYRVCGQSIEIFEIRPIWNKPSEYQESPIAKATFTQKQQVWKIYWQRSDLRWHSYPPKPQVKTLEEFIAEVDADPHGCFWG